MLSISSTSPKLRSQHSPRKLVIHFSESVILYTMSQSQPSLHYTLNPTLFCINETIRQRQYHPHGIYFRMPLTRQNLDRRLMRTASCEVWIPQLDLMLDPGMGEFKQLRAFLTQIHDRTAEYFGQSDNPKVGAFLGTMREVIEGRGEEMDETPELHVRDVLGNAFVTPLADDDSQEFITANFIDSTIHIEHFERTPEMEVELEMESRVPLTGDEGMRELVRLINESKRIVVLSGEELSKESGIPTFRGNVDVRDALEELGDKNPKFKSFSQITSIEWMSFGNGKHEYSECTHSETIERSVWTQDMLLHHIMSHAVPNLAHDFVAHLEQLGKLHLLTTQNIDDLHDATGIPPEKIVKVHGTIHEVECEECSWKEDSKVFFELWNPESDELPQCEKCSGKLKTATISFGQELRQDDMDRSQDALEECDLFIVMGSSLRAAPINDFPRIAFQRNVPVALINAEESSMDSVVDIRLQGKAGFEICSQLLKELRSNEEHADSTVER